MNKNTLTVEIHCPYCDSVYDTVVISEQLAAAQARIAELEAALRDIIAENANPQSGYGRAVVEIARAALAGDEPAKE